MNLFTFNSKIPKGPCKRTQQVTTLLRVVGGFWPTMLRPFAWAQKFDRFQTISSKCQQVPTLLWFHANGRNMLGPTMLRPFAWAQKFDRFQTIRSKCQHCCGSTQTDATCWPQQCCVRLHGPKSLIGFKLYAASANIVVVPRKRTQHVGPNNVACCWPTMLRSFTWAQKFDRFQTIRSKCQQVPTLLWFHANGRNMLGPTMLRPFAWAQKFDRFQTIRNKCQQVPLNIVVVPRKRTQHVGPKNVASVCMGLKVCWVPKRRHSG